MASKIYNGIDNVHRTIVSPFKSVGGTALRRIEALDPGNPETDSLSEDAEEAGSRRPELQDKYANQRYFAMAGQGRELADRLLDKGVSPPQVQGTRRARNMRLLPQDFADAKMRRLIDAERGEIRKQIQKAKKGKKEYYYYLNINDVHFCFLFIKYYDSVLLLFILSIITIMNIILNWLFLNLRFNLNFVCTKLSSKQQKGTWKSLYRRCRRCQTRDKIWKPNLQANLRLQNIERSAVACSCQRRM